MRDDYTHIGIVLDASGSMSSIESDTKGTFNSFLKEQRKESGKTVFDLYQFANKTSHLVDSADLAQFDRDLMADYHCGGGTALNDAICQAVDELGAKFAAMREEDRPSCVIIAIITDGKENSSRRFTHEDVKNRIQHQTDVYQWDFLFLAANIDVFATGDSYGIRQEKCVPFTTSSSGMAMFESAFRDQVAKSKQESKDRREGK